MARPPSQSEIDPEQNVEKMRRGIDRLFRRLEEVRAFETVNASGQLNPGIEALEARVKETLADVFGPNSRSYRAYIPAATINRGGPNLSGTSPREYIIGVDQGKQRSLPLLQSAITILQERIEEARSAGPQTRPIAGTAPLAITTQGATVLNLAAPQARLTTRGESFDLLSARVAILEATMASKPAGLGHNRGPGLDETLDVDDAGIQNLIALLKEQRPTGPVNLPELTEAAKVADPANNKWRERADKFAMGMLNGAGMVIGKKLTEELVPAGWFSAVHSALEAVHHALMSWLNFFQ